MRFRAAILGLGALLGAIGCFGCNAGIKVETANVDITGKSVNAETNKDTNARAEGGMYPTGTASGNPATGVDARESGTGLTKPGELNPRAGR